MVLTLISIINGFIRANVRVRSCTRVQSISSRCGAESTSALARTMAVAAAALGFWRNGASRGQATMVFGPRSFWHDVSGVERAGGLAGGRTRDEITLNASERACALHGGNSHSTVFVCISVRVLTVEECAAKVSETRISRANAAHRRPEICKQHILGDTFYITGHARAFGCARARAADGGAQIQKRIS